MSESPDQRRFAMGVGRLAGLLLAGRTAWRAARHRERVPVAAPSGSNGGPVYDPTEKTVPADRRAETLVILLFGAAALSGIGFVLLYALVQTNTQLLGVALGVTLLCVAAATIVLGKLVVPQETSVEPRDVLLKEEVIDEVVERVQTVGEGVSRRGLLVGAGGLAGTCLVGATLAPVASMGPPAGILHQSAWKRGIRLVDDQGNVFAAKDIAYGTFYTALPEGGNWESLSAGLLVVRLPPQWLDLPADRRGWAPEGILAYSKICPHAGCAISLYRYPLDAQTTNDPPAFTCPCHYSTFLPGDGGKLVFGPAGRDLPQLPLMIDAEGNLRCAGRFDSDVGPSWWGIRRVNDGQRPRSSGSQGHPLKKL